MHGQFEIVRKTSYADITVNYNVLPVLLNKYQRLC